MFTAAYRVGVYSLPKNPTLPHFPHASRSQQRTFIRVTKERLSMAFVKRVLRPVTVSGIFFTLCGFSFIGCSSAHCLQGKKDLALIQASRQGDVYQVSTLLNAGADINAVDEEGWTPYLAASAEGNWNVMKLLQAKGCKTDPGF
jgi:ankyrin repeat protein